MRSMPQEQGMKFCIKRVIYSFFFGLREAFSPSHHPHKYNIQCKALIKNWHIVGSISLHIVMPLQLDICKATKKS